MWIRARFHHFEVNLCRNLDPMHCYYEEFMTFLLHFRLFSLYFLGRISKLQRINRLTFSHPLKVLALFRVILKNILCVILRHIDPPGITLCDVPLSTRSLNQIQTADWLILRLCPNTLWLNLYSSVLVIKIRTMTFKKMLA